MTQTFFSRHALLPGGWAADVRLTLGDGDILAVEPQARPQPGDIGTDFLLPALGNLHSHAFQRAFSGLTETRANPVDSFWSWREIMYRAALALRPDELEAIAAQLYMEMIEAGFGRVGEFHYLHHDADGQPYAHIAEMAERLAAASQQAGIGLTLLPVLYTHGGIGGAPATPGQRRFLNSTEGYARLFEASAAVVAGLERGRIGVAPHSLRAVTPEQLVAVQAIAGARPIHIHVAEQMREVEECLARTGKRPVEWLLENAPLDRRWCLIHATHLTPAEVQGLLTRGATVGLCPLTEANLGDGIFPAAEFTAAGGAFGIGSDQNVRISAAQELAQLEYSQRLRLQSRNVLAEGLGSTGQGLYLRASAGADPVLDATGGLRPGAEANLISFRADQAPWIGAPALLDSWIFGNDQRPDCVWVRGRRLVEGGRHILRDRIGARFTKVMTGLAARL